MFSSKDEPEGEQWSIEETLSDIADHCHPRTVVHQCQVLQGAWWWWRCTWLSKSQSFSNMNFERYWKKYWEKITTFCLMHMESKNYTLIFRNTSFWVKTTNCYYLQIQIYNKWIYWTSEPHSVWCLTYKILLSSKPHTDESTFLISFFTSILP